MITGMYDGSCMITISEEEYPVPAKDGSMIYKLIQQAPRTHIMGIIHKKNNKYMALGADNKNYSLNTAAVTFFKAQCGDEVCMIINQNSEVNHAALECVLK